MVRQGSKFEGSYSIVSVGAMLRSSLVPRRRSDRGLSDFDFIIDFSMIPVPGLGREALRLKGLAMRSASDRTRGAFLGCCLFWFCEFSGNSSRDSVELGAVDKGCTSSGKSGTVGKIVLKCFRRRRFLLLAGAEDAVGSEFLLARP